MTPGARHWTSRCATAATTLGTLTSGRAAARPGSPSRTRGWSQPWRRTWPSWSAPDGSPRSSHANAAASPQPPSPNATGSAGTCTTGSAPRCPASRWVWRPQARHSHRPRCRAGAARANAGRGRGGGPRDPPGPRRAAPGCARPARARGCSAGHRVVARHGPARWPGLRPPHGRVAAAAAPGRGGGVPDRRGVPDERRAPLGAPTTAPFGSARRTETFGSGCFDDGRGLSPEPARDTASTRCAGAPPMSGDSLHVERASPHGTLVTAVLPLERRHDDPRRAGRRPPDVPLRADRDPRAGRGIDVVASVGDGGGVGARGRRALARRRAHGPVDARPRRRRGDHAATGHAARAADPRAHHARGRRARLRRAARRRPRLPRQGRRRRGDRPRRPFRRLR